MRGGEKQRRSELKGFELTFIATSIEVDDDDDENVHIEIQKLLWRFYTAPLF